MEKNSSLTKTNEIHFISHACITVDMNDSETLLCDPWFVGGIFNDSWSLVKKPNFEKIDFSKIKHIWMSHEHPDHLNWPTLKILREKIQGKATIYFHKEEKDNVKNAIEDLGFDFVWLYPHKELEISSGFFLNSFPTGIDSAVVIRTPNLVILNQNDCQLKKSEVKAIQKRYPKIDAWFFQFSLAGYYANHDDSDGLKKAKEKHLALIREYYQAFRPTTFIPFASFVFFSKEANAFLNSWRVSLDEIIEKLPNLPIQIMWENDELLFDNWQERTKKNLILWRTAFKEPFEIKKNIEVTESELINQGKKMVCESLGGWKSLFKPGETHLQILETGRAAIIDFGKKQFRIEAKSEKDKLAGILPSEELLFFLKYPWGADTLNITSCFYVTNPKKWKYLLGYRELLYRTRPLSSIFKKAIPAMMG